jgi:hypothetical protein
MKIETNKNLKKNSLHRQKISPLPKELHKKRILVWHKFAKMFCRKEKTRRQIYLQKLC